LNYMRFIKIVRKITQFKAVNTTLKSNARTIMLQVQRMFAEAELREKGAKRAVLEYIAQDDKSIPTPETVDETDDHEGVILRSDHWREFDDFYGIFESVALGRTRYYDDHGLNGKPFTNADEALGYIFLRETGVTNIDRKLKWRREVFDEYCKAKSLDPDEVLSELRVLRQRFVDSRINGTMLLHPNVSDRHIIYMSTQDNQMYSFMTDSSDDSVQSTTGCFFRCGAPKTDFPETLPLRREEMEKIIATYNRITHMPNLKDGYSYMMEFTFDPFFVLQVRRFRRIEDGSGLRCDWKDEQDVFETGLTFGTTPQEGVELPLFVGPTGYGYVFECPDWNEEFHRFNGEHPEGFAYDSNVGNWYTRTFVKNAYAALGGGFGHYFNHGNAATFSEMPVYLFNVRIGHERAETLPRYGKYSRQGKVRVFSNGKEGFVKLEI